MRTTNRITNKWLERMMKAVGVKNDKIKAGVLHFTLCYKQLEPTRHCKPKNAFAAAKMPALRQS